MLPDWFNEWNAKHRTDIYGPAIVTGIVGVGVIGVIAVLAFGSPVSVSGLQTGPRGTGMAVVAFESSITAPDPTIAGFLASTSAPVPPQGGEQTAGDAYENAPPVLADLTVANYDRLLAAMRTWTGIPDLLEDPTSYQSGVAAIMISMTQNMNENWDGHVNANGEVGVTCYTCHRGQPVPQGIWFQQTPAVRYMAGFGGVQNSVTPLSSYTSLPSDALERYLVEAETIGVHDLESRVAGGPSPERGSLPAWQHTERTFALMNYFANSLGANCTLCHNTRAFYDGGQVTPQWATASLGIQMVQELNNEWIMPAGQLLPPERLGPAHGDVPKVACRTCHLGYQQPLQGTNVIADWPELATTGEPQYPAATQ